MTRIAIALTAAVLVLSMSACTTPEGAQWAAPGQTESVPSVEPQPDETLAAQWGPAQVEADHTGGRTFRVTDSGQPFDFMLSVAALAALGPEVSGVLTDLDYDHNSGVWERFITTQALRKLDGPTAATSVASLGIIQRNSGGAFLSPEQVRIVEDYLSWAAGQQGYIDNEVVAANLALAATQFDHEVAALVKHPDLSRVKAPEGVCGPETWAEQPWEVAAHFMVRGTDACTSAEVTTAWNHLADAVDERIQAFADEADRVHLVEMIGLLNVVRDGSATTLGRAGTARFASIRDAYLSSLAEDPWEWLWGYFKFEFDHDREAAQAPVTPAARAILSHFAARGVPRVSEVQ